MDKCKACGADIMWVKTQTGSSTPVDSASAQKRYVKHQDGTWRLSDTFVSHFATCPKADQFRKPGGSR